jgi:hypothetical protein
MRLITRSVFPGLFKELDLVAGISFTSAMQFTDYMKNHYNLDVIAYPELQRGTFYIDVSDKKFTLMLMQWA